MTEKISEEIIQYLDREFDPSLLVKDNVLSAHQLAELYRPFNVNEHEWHKHFGICYIKEEAINRRLTAVMGDRWSKVVTNRMYIDPKDPTVRIGEIDVPIKQAYPDGYELFNVGATVKARPRPGNLMTIERAPERVQGLENVLSGDGELMFPDGVAPMSQNMGAVTGHIIDREVKFDVGIVLTEGYIEYGGVRRYSIGGDKILSLGKEMNERIMNTFKGSDTDMFKRCARYWGPGLYLTQLSTSETPVKDATSLRAWLARTYPLDMRFRNLADCAKAIFVEMRDQFPRLVRSGQDVSVKLNELGIQLSPDNYYETRDELLRNFRALNGD